MATGCGSAPAPQQQEQPGTQLTPGNHVNTPCHLSLDLQSHHILHALYAGAVAAAGLSAVAALNGSEAYTQDAQDVLASAEHLTSQVAAHLGTKDGKSGMSTYGQSLPCNQHDIACIYSYSLPLALFYIRDSIMKDLGRAQACRHSHSRDSRLLSRHTACLLL